ncbi:NnrS family protein [Marilutibacter maris]|uniref:Short-chain dehydrogenase n=1 Tax=Marilutibacter maris TaxID=1605891 RepID=A0A2U9T1W7_9GAMM|nr:NnrS family protein [Lysobacter maris]AWV06381.1 short-chain dehydrogenase [Lysobacter maris]
MHDSSALPPPSLHRLGGAPHRLMFFIGCVNLLAAMLWWTAWLAAARGALPAMPQPQPYAGWLHAFVMQYQMLPSFIFGFLLTTFPRWLDLPGFTARRFLPVGAGMFGGQLATLLGALGWGPGISVGLAMTAAGWLAGLIALGGCLLRDRDSNWHARSCFAALAIGFVGLLFWGGHVWGGSATAAFVSIKLGTFGMLLPVYLTVAHRMFPFFASRVVPGYVPWRPGWVLALFWALLAAHLTLELHHAYAWLWLVDIPLLAGSAMLLLRWWPDRPAPGLLKVLFLGSLWLPLTFALYAAQSAAYQLTGAFWLGRAPAHALFIGFFGSVLIAMVTRVTRGHSGRSLRMPPIAWFAFATIQLCALSRIGAELAAAPLTWQLLSASLWLLALGPWALRMGHIYLSPRVDGKPG